jgi:hypothetical protein
MDGTGCAPSEVAVRWAAERAGRCRVRAEDVGGDGGGARWSTVGVSQGARRKQGGILMSREWKRTIRPRTPASVAASRLGASSARECIHTRTAPSTCMYAPYRNNGVSSHTLYSTYIYIVVVFTQLSDNGVQE